MALKVIGLASLGLALAAGSMAHAAVGLTQTVYYNDSFSGTPAYSFVNSLDGFQYSDTTTIASFFGADAAGAAQTDTNAASSVSFTASGDLDVLTPGVYTFKFYADDSASISLDGTQILHGSWQNGWVSQDETLSAGDHPFQLSYVAEGTPNGFSYGLTGPDGASGFDYVTSVSAVPEPSTWAMAIVGLGLAGAMLRRRQRQGLAAAAA